VSLTRIVYGGTWLALVAVFLIAYGLYGIVMNIRGRATVNGLFYAIFGLALGLVALIAFLRKVKHLGVAGALGDDITIID